jgi:type II secretory pathway component PulJ
VQQWNDQQWAVIILCGFTLFAVVIALVIQQVINFSS